MEVVDPREFLLGGLFREKSFRESIQAYNWQKFQDKPVLIQGCASPLPVWAYLTIMGELVPRAKSISFGEVSAPIPVLGKLGAAG